MRTTRYVARGFPLVATAAIAIPIQASAHVKWFSTSVNVTLPPVRPSGVLTPVFLACVCAFALMIFLGFLADGWAARSWPALASSGGRHAEAEEKLIRLAAGAYFLCLWDTGGTILTPELLSDATWVNVLQFAVAVLVIWRPTCILAGFGIGALYAYGIAQYGIFHMIDYVFFPGIAAYLALTSVGSPGASWGRVPLLIGSLAFSLSWTAIEKFLYPGWTTNILAGKVSR